MKRILVAIIATSIVLAFALSAHALLIDRGGGMIYSPDMDVTWLVDANFAMTSGYDDDGFMTWGEANTWAENLSYGGYDDWRLPTFDPDYNREDVATNPTQAAQLSELAYLRYGELEPDPSIYTFDPSPFTNLIDTVNSAEPWYWSGTTFNDPDTGDIRAWRFDFSCGWWDAPSIVGDYTNHAWAVRDGDVAPVPEPATLLLLGTGLVGLAGFGRKRFKG